MPRMRGRPGVWTQYASVVHNHRSPILNFPRFRNWEKHFMRLKTVSVLLLYVVFVATASAQTPHHVAVHAGHVLDVKSGKMMSDQMLVIEDGKIVSSGASREAKIPTDAMRIELPNATVMPGFIDAHTHLTMDPKFGYDALALSTSREALIGAKNARLTLLAGFTTVRNVGARVFTD